MSHRRTSLLPGQAWQTAEPFAAVGCRFLTTGIGCQEARNTPVVVNTIFSIPSESQNAENHWDLRL